MKKSLIIAAFALFASTAAFAQSTFDAATGSGFITKNAVLSALGWNNADATNNASTAVFTYTATSTYEVECTWITGPATNRKTHVQDYTTTSGINSAVSFDTRKNSKGVITGFILGGYSTTSSSDIPKIGDACDADEANANGTLSAVTLIGSNDGVLKVNDVPVDLSL